MFGYVAITVMLYHTTNTVGATDNLIAWYIIVILFSINL